MNSRTAIAAIIILISLIITSCATPREPTPAQTIAQVKDACQSACKGIASTLVVPVPENATFYSTESSLCIKRQAKLFCGTCACPIASNMSINTPGNYTCEFTGTDETLAVRCR